MSGKNKCKILKEIRQKIAEDNDIAFVTSECRYQGECSGTCPRCEEELRYLENELAKRKKMGKTVAIAGIAAAILATAGSCAAEKLVKEIEDNMTQGFISPEACVYSSESDL